MDSVSWRLVFFINLPLALVAIGIALRYVPETRDQDTPKVPDVLGGVAAAVGLGGIVFALIEGPARGWGEPLVVAAGSAGALSLVAFFWLEKKLAHPMMPLTLFRSRQFSAANGTTLLVYAALSGAMFLLVLQLQKVLGYSALEAGAALVPLTVLLLLLSPTAGKLSQRWGPRGPMTLGPLLAAAGLALLVRVGSGESYVASVLPGVSIFGLGMAITVAPLTTAVLTAAPGGHSGIASGINNAVARVAGLLAVVLIPLGAGLSGIDDVDLIGFSDGFRRSMLIASALCLAGAVTSFAGIRRPPTAVTHSPPAPDQPAEALR